MMEWYNIIGLLLGAFGGVSGIISLYNAKSNKDTIDISNFHSLIEEERTERKNLKEEYQEYKNNVEKKVDKVKKEVEKIQMENKKMGAAILQAYRCKLPDKIYDCPVVKMFANNEKTTEMFSVFNDLDNLHGTKRAE